MYICIKYWYIINTVNYLLYTPTYEKKHSAIKSQYEFSVLGFTFYLMEFYPPINFRVLKYFDYRYKHP